MPSSAAGKKKKKKRFNKKRHLLIRLFLFWQTRHRTWPIKLETVAGSIGTVDNSLGGVDIIAWESTNHLTLEPKAYDCILIINFLGSLEFSVILIDFPHCFEGCGKSLLAWNLKQV